MIDRPALLAAKAEREAQSEQIIAESMSNADKRKLGRPKTRLPWCMECGDDLPVWTQERFCPNKPCRGEYAAATGGTPIARVLP